MPNHAHNLHQINLSQCILLQHLASKVCNCHLHSLVTCTYSEGEELMIIFAGNTLYTPTPTKLHVATLLSY